jgi:hypothetical protein
MRRLPIILLALLLLAQPMRVSAADEMLWEKTLPFKEATISYLIKGMEEGHETLYIRKGGKERATHRETVSNMMGMKMTNSTVTIRDAELIYTYDLAKREGFKSVNPQKHMIEEYKKLSPADQAKVRESAKKMGMAFTEGMDGKVSANAVEILGYSCDKVEIMGGSVTYLIHDTDITLKTEMNIMGMSLTMIAEKVDKGKADDRFFQHPPGIVAEVNAQADEIAKSMAIQAIAMLKNPEGAKKNLLLPPQALGEGGMDMSPEEREEMMQQMEEMMKGLHGVKKPQ